MRFIVDPVVGISSDDILSKIKNDLAFIEKCEKDPNLIGSDAWSCEIEESRDELSSLRTSFKYSTIGYIEYHHWQNLLTKAQFFTSRALRDHLFNRGATRNSVSASSCRHLLLDSMKDLKSAVEKIDLYAVSRLSVSSSTSKDIVVESINYVVRLAKINYSRSNPENKIILGKQLVFVEGILSHTSSPCVMSEHEVPAALLADIHAAMDTVMKIISEFDSSRYLRACTDKGAIDLSTNDYDSLDNNCAEVVKYIQLISLVIYTVVEMGASSSWRDEVVVKFWDCVIDNMLHLLQQESNLIVSWKDQLEVLHDEMSFLKYFLLDPPEEYTGAEHWNEILWRIKLEMCKQVTSLLYSFYDGTIDDATFGQIKESAELIKSLFIDDFQVPKYIGSNHLEIHDLGSFDSFQEKMSILTFTMSDSIPLCRTKQILEQLTTTAESLSTSSGQQTTLEDLWRQIWELAYEMENTLESIGVRGIPVWHRMLWFFDIEEQIKLIEGGVSMIPEVACSIWDKNTGHISDYISVDEEVIGFLDEETNVVDFLVRGSEDMEIVSIVGMPGLGKTTLAKKVYHNPTVRDYFNVCAWCCVSQVYQIKDLFLQILKHIILINKETLSIGEDELAEILRKALKKQKYLIVMDDIWDNNSWNALRRSFPNDSTGSRVLLTSRFSYLNLQPESRIHPLRHLSDDECWELLQKKLFQRGNCPLELLEVGRSISIDCKGLPLAVVVVAGLLLDMNTDQWQKVANDVMSFIVHDSLNLAGLLELSYKNLPYFLKPCFLYLGAFPPDSEISVQKLLQLWISEGFIRRTESKSLEFVAENYLMDLIRRNLLHVAKRRSLGGPKTCHIHDLIHGFCLTKGREENFLQTDEGFIGERFICHRLSVHFNGGLISEKWSFYESALSLLTFSSFDTDVAMYILQNFKLLRVLDLMSPLIWHMIDLPDSIGSLVHLRYLAGKFSSVPASMGNLANLKTFHMVALTDAIYLPRTFYNLGKLQHLDINCVTIFEETSSDYHSHFDDLQTLSTLLLSESDSTILRRFPNLRKLKCIFRIWLENFSRFKLFPVLDLLNHLESLEVTYLLGDWDELQRQPRMHQAFSFPSSLKKLTLKMFCLPWSSISIIGKLPNLGVLKLDRSAFVGEDWFTEDGMFNKLKYLRLRGLNIRMWHTSHDHFPLIERLVVQGCEYLEEIPACFCDAFTLKMIEVSGCKISVEDSARQIKEDQLDYGNEELKILTRDNGDNKRISGVGP
ncbi:hypothetical protein Leryth_020559 [Lithospermum erythrorhizon]|nr:hypothetical protein Leryth_020559 [Lithospermum erythrorhizon]